MVRTSCKADQNRFPGWEKRLFLYIGLWCKRKAWRSPKPQISVQVRTDLLWLFSVIGNTSGSEPEVVGSNPARAAHGLLVQKYGFDSRWGERAASAAKMQEHSPAG